MNRSFEQLKNELGRGVGPLLPDVPTGEFEQFIEQMAILQYRHDMQQQAVENHQRPLHTDGSTGWIQAYRPVSGMGRGGAG